MMDVEWRPRNRNEWIFAFRPGEYIAVCGEDGDGYGWFWWLAMWGPDDEEIIRDHNNTEVRGGPFPTRDEAEAAALNDERVKRWRGSR